MSELETTCWRGMQIAHPPDWELAVASPAEKPGQCTFADRRYHRLDVRWRRLSYRPDMKMLVEKYRNADAEKKTGDARITPSGDLPAPWRGMLQKMPTGTVSRAMRFFDEERLLVEVAVVWPARRNTDLERRILTGLGPLPGDGPVRRWRAMGLDLSIGRDFELTDAKLMAGRIHLKFAPGKGSKGTGPVVVERLALPEQWMQGPLQEWLGRQLPPNSEVVRRQSLEVNGHHGEELLSRRRINWVATWRGLRRVRLERAWLCPREGRLYRLWRETVSRSESLALPDSLTVRCCQPSEAIVKADEAFGGQAERPRPAGRSAEEFLQAVPVANQRLEVHREGGRMVLGVPLKKPWYYFPPVSWLARIGTHRRLELDPVGIAVFEACDGNRTVEKTIEKFAADHKLTFREAQVPVTKFLRQLTHRGVLVIVGPQDLGQTEAAANARQRKHP